MDREAMVRYSPWGYKESDMSEQLTLSPDLEKIYGKQILFRICKVISR